MPTKSFAITMTDGNVQFVEAHYYSYDEGQYIFWKYNDSHEAQEVYRVFMILVTNISSTIQER